MDLVFIINPIAGSGKRQSEIKMKIESAAREMKFSYVIYETTCVGDACRFAAEYMAPESGACLFACGGDGTLNEVANGIAENKASDKLILGMIPIGTGNDFTKCFGDIERFCDIPTQIEGNPIVIDAIRFSADNNHDKLAVNMFNMGFDSAVVAQSERIRRFPLLSGPISYTIGIIVELFSLPHENLTIIIDDSEVITGEFLLTAIGNGTHYGGGYNATPDARINDGMLNMTLVKMTSRLNFISLVGAYKNGTIRNSEAGKKLVIYKKLKTLSIIAHRRTSICIDGELFRAHRLDLTVIPGLLRFNLPKGISY
ncbi:Lipid kinase YegS [bioreactor metagenome]|uniref:Lipid kinase YegS n=1 Tax=bioreactor metagenome TaxID=1076179 RepID=A0A644ZLG3_9ZZZZ|nr:diacylglycerol kinase family protein [Oscillospiraceae bacterium]